MMNEQPWKDEPDHVDFRHAGLACLLHRNPELGNWCAYVGVPPGHPAHGCHYTALAHVIDCHGGLTYASACSGPICHVPAFGESDDVWWLGFDCAHAGDLLPQMVELRRLWGPTPFDDAAPYEGYRDLAYVRAETKRLAEQLSVLPPAAVGYSAPVEVLEP